MSKDTVVMPGAEDQPGQRQVPTSGSPNAPAAGTASVAPPPDPPPEGKHDNAIERWFADHFHNSPVSRETSIFNHVRAAVDDLKKRLHA